MLHPAFLAGRAWSYATRNFPAQVALARRKRRRPKKSASSSKNRTRYEIGGVGALRRTRTVRAGLGVAARRPYPCAAVLLRLPKLDVKKNQRSWDERAM